MKTPSDFSHNTTHNSPFADLFTFEALFQRALTTVHTRSCLFQHKLLDFVALRPTGFVFLQEAD